MPLFSLFAILHTYIITYTPYYYYTYIYITYATTIIIAAVTLLKVATTYYAIDIILFTMHTRAATHTLCYTLRRLRHIIADWCYLLHAIISCHTLIAAAPH